MKAIVIASAFLMSGAIVYGFVDYTNVSSDKKFRNMYHETTATNVLATELVDNGALMVQKGVESILIEAPVLVEISAPVKSKKQVKKKRKVSLKEFSRAALVE